MTFASVRLKMLLLLCLLFQSIVFSQAEWSDPPFLMPEDVEDVVWSLEYNAASGRTTIKLEEEVDHEVCIAVINYDGKDPEPLVGPLSENKSNLVLGAKVRYNATIGRHTLWITKRQDYETPMMQSYRFPIWINSLQNAIALDIVNIDDNTPVISWANERGCLIEENYSGLSNCTYVVSDADGWIDQIKTKLIVSPDDGGKNFEFKTSRVGGANAEYQLDAVLNVLESLDFENISMYSVTIHAIDGVGHDGILNAVVEVKDMPDEPPQWTHLIAAENILEKTSKTFAVQAIDGDIQINAEINYRIEVTEERDAAFFVVDKKTGVITINPIDRDKLEQEVFRFTIFAYEVPEPESSINATIIVIVGDQNDHSPEITPEVLTIEIEEEKFMTLEFDSTIAIDDPDLADNAQFTVSLHDSSKYKWSSAFLVVPTSGYQHGIFTISVVNASLLDYEDENWRVIDLELRAVEKANASHIGTRNIHIKLLNWNDELPIFDKNTVSEVAIPEDVDVDTFIATVHATDRDVDDNVTHSLVAQRTLTIDEKSGRITTREALDYETMPQVVVQVLATDLANHTTYATLKINVIDVNDVPPYLCLPKQIPSLVEELPNDSRVLALINATDVDTEAELEFSVDWDNSRALKNSIPVDPILYREHLRIVTVYPEDGNTRKAEGTLLVSGRIDYEAFDVMFLTISVTDLTTVHNENTTSAPLTLNIIDINDNSPIFGAIEAMEVVENQKKDVLIAPVTAKDADGELYNKVSYYIEPVNGTKSGLIYINKTTGAIRVDLNEAIDADAGYEYIYYDVTASDGQRNTTLPIAIYVIDENDEEPYLLGDQFPSIVCIPEKSPNGMEIVRIFAKDNDRTSPYNNVSYLINVNYSAPMQYFSMGRFDGLLQVNLLGDYILDRDYGPSEFNLNLLFRDNYLVDGSTYNTNSIYSTIKIILRDINDKIPKLPEMSVPAATASEDSKKGTEILRVIAKDDDDPETVNTKVFYRILKISPADDTNAELREDCKTLFGVETIEQSEAKIFANCDLRGYYGRWNLELYAQDLGVDPGPLNDTHTYVIQISDVNYNEPVIVFPTSKSIPLNAIQTLHAPLRTYDDQQLDDFKATDEDFGNSGVVSFNISSTNGDHEYFELVPISQNVAQLRLARDVNITQQHTYTLTLLATDHGTPSRQTQRQVTLRFISALGPEFVEHEWDVWIHENKEGMNFSVAIPQAQDMLGEEENSVKIYYFLYKNSSDAENDDLKHFALEKETGELTVKEELDREKQPIMTLYVVATTSSDRPPGNPHPRAVLKITVIVLDVNDNPPVFEYIEIGFYHAGVAMGDPVDNIILTAKATDADLNDTLTYSIVADNMTTSDSSLNGVARPFDIDSETGELRVKFTVTSSMKGLFTFYIAAHDAVEHSDTRKVHIYIVEQKNRVVFTFNNNATYIKDQKMFLTDSFSKSFAFVCNVDGIESTLGSNGQVLDDMSTLTTHFINPNDQLPIDSNAIILSSGDLQTITNLKLTLLTKSLRLVDVPTGSSPETDGDETLHWMLVSMTTFFCICTIALLVALIMRNRSLTQRLDKLAITKYGSQESGLDRAGVVPTTNQFAVAGSNPMWNTEKNSIEDNVSQGSGDSDLIGVEDNPDFGYARGGFAPDDRWENVRRGSVNPVLATHGALSGGQFDRISYPEEEKKNNYN